MASHTIERESQRRTRSDIVLALVISAVALSMTIYGAVVVAELIAQWFARPF